MIVSRIVLASASPRRRDIFASLGVPTDVQPSTYQELDDPTLTPLQLAERHAAGKAHDVASRRATGFVVGADTVVDVDGTALGKPRDTAEAERMLRLLSGRTHVVHTAYTAVDAERTQVTLSGARSTAVTFYTLSDDEITNYVRSGEPMDKAGAYGIQGHGATLVERIDGDFYTVMGFPLAAFVRALRSAGIALASVESTV